MIITNRNYSYEIFGDIAKIYYKLTPHMLNKNNKCTLERNIDTQVKNGILTILIDTKELDKLLDFTLVIAGRHWEKNNSHKKECWQILMARRIGNGKTYSKQIHRHILNVTNSNVQVDHINQNQLDNRKENLRLVSNLQNQHNVSRPRICNKSGFRNVHRKEVNGNEYWLARVKRLGKNIIKKCFPYTESGLIQASQAVERAIEKFNLENPIIDLRLTNK